MKEKVTILLAAYNSGKTIYETLNSITEQDYPNLQLIVCDDGSSDFDQEKTEAFLRGKRPSMEWILLHQPENVGTVRNLNAGLEKADGTWVMTLAADDLFASADSVSSIVSAAQTGDARWVVAKTALCDEKMIRSGKSEPSEKVAEMIRKKDRQQLLFALCQNCCLPSGGNLYRLQDLKSKGGFDETYRLTEDWPLFLSLLREGAVPVLTEKEAVLHRFGGVSRKKAGKNFVYQKDLITVLQREVMPYLEELPREEKKRMQRYIQEKELGFSFRFHCKNKVEQLLWAICHPGFFLRKLKHRREKIC